MTNSRFVVVGIGADGWPGLSQRARDELRSARVIYGARRQLDLLEDVDAELRPWQSPMSVHLAQVLEQAAAPAPVVHILASGDPMFHGVGTTIARSVGAQRTTVIPAVSSASLACARLGWDLTSTRIVSLVTRDESAIRAEITGGAQLLVLSRDENSARVVAGLLTAEGFGASTMTVLAQLGGPAEAVTSGRAETWDAPAGDRLNIVAIDCVGPSRSALPGRPDADYAHDGQITKSAYRSITVCALEPAGPQLLWDIGAGSGSIAIEWLRADERGTAITFERDAARAERALGNAGRYGVADRLIQRGGAPGALPDAPAPDAIFIGGGLSPAVLTHCVAALRPGGRLVANAVATESQQLLGQWHRDHGGVLRRIMIETVEPLGTLTTWRPALPIVQWVWRRELEVS
ncbi:precorrin-6y C5,15-methyltransferase (decarboxylating) subunit CbiE [Gordonia sp. ABSL1-1]|uniref:precorrin-6y C5,15-methyltransferase (decarboxylating) subunit CbiE n=1 Tax=Gordonia sp. ABSL1-1 TaxID=3053923 RepID=UPI0025733B85|nr:precorrin-6y C5,15-methyltransferase (decarboxylating) subunit CbiE [Gordonia sp. ABSL1-1]MDL9935916.1 precorrin-6y C5,15-methyltransferase (decarboxylating) subunit CbiE [Gordonia sp. ABSL1-1]